jgi:hypothetical protein
MAKHKFTSIYIGAAHNADERFKKYKAWKFRYALYRTSSVKVAKLGEVEIINFAGTEFLDTCNISKDSKGLKEGKPQYYLYMIADDTCKKRN